MRRKEKYRNSFGREGEAITSLTKKPEQEMCVWTRRYCQSLYRLRCHTGCGAFFLSDDSGQEKDFDFCPYCGKPIEFKEVGE